MEEAKTSDRQIETIVGSDEDVVCVLGEAVLKSGGPIESLQRSVLVLTDENLYQVGVYFAPDEQRKLVKHRGQNRVPLEDLIDLELVERPVALKIRNIGAALLVVGTAILLAGITEGGVLGLVLGLFLGAVWMMVPGGLMLFHWKTGGEAFLQVTHRSGVIAAACRRYPEDELSAFVNKCTARIAKTDAKSLEGGEG